MSKILKFLLIWGIFLQNNYLLAENLANSSSGSDQQEASLEPRTKIEEIWSQRFLFNNYDFVGDECVLEIGSADGKLSSLIAKSAPQGNVLGIDSSQSMIDLASGVYSDIDNLKFMTINIGDLSFYTGYKGKFDLIIGVNMFQLIQDHKTVLEGIKTALSGKGRFYLRIPSSGASPILDIADSLKSSKQFLEYFTDFKNPVRRFSLEEYTELLKNSGLQVIDLQEVTERDKVTGKENLIAYIKTWLPHYYCLQQQRSAPNIAEEFVNQLALNYLMRYPPKKSDNTIELYDRFLEVVGK